MYNGDMAASMDTDCWKYSIFYVSCHSNIEIDDDLEREKIKWLNRREEKQLIHEIYIYNIYNYSNDEETPQLIDLAQTLQK